MRNIFKRSSKVEFDTLCKKCSRKISFYSFKEAFGGLLFESGSDPRERAAKAEERGKEREEKFKAWSAENLDDCAECTRLTEIYVKKKMAELFARVPGLEPWKENLP